MTEADPADGPRLRVREARLDDLDAIVDLLADGPGGGRRDDVDLAPYAAAFARIASDRNQIQAVAELGGQIVGTLQLSLVASLARGGATSARIEGVRTLSTLRGRGIGEALFDWAFTTARARGATLVQLTSDDAAAGEHRFYERLGFARGQTGFGRPL